MPLSITGHADRLAAAELGKSLRRAAVNLCVSPRVGATTLNIIFKGQQWACSRGATASGPSCMLQQTAYPFYIVFCGYFKFLSPLLNHHAQYVGPAITNIKSPIKFPGSGKHYNITNIYYQYGIYFWL